MSENAIENLPNDDVPPTTSRSVISNWFNRVPKSKLRVTPQRPGPIKRFVRKVHYECIKNSVRNVSKAIEKRIVRAGDVRRVLDHKIKNIPILRSSNAHTHPMCAGERTGVTIFLQDLARDSAYEPYTVSMSGSDQLNGEEGSRYFFWAKDFTQEMRDDPIKHNSCLIFIDVDYHVDMNKYLKMFKPLLIYTLVPTSAGYRDKEIEYCFVGNKVQYRVSGGSEYSHEIWDYKGDVVTVIDKHKNLLVFHVTQHVLKDSPERRVISILPAVSVPYPYYESVKQSPLMRKVYNDDGVTFVDSTLDDTISLALEGSADSVRLRRKLYDAIKIRMESSLVSPKPGDVEFMLYKAFGDKSDVAIDACLLYKIMMRNFTPRTNVVATTSIATTFQPVGPLTHEEFKSPCQVITTPIVTIPAVFPAPTFNSEVASATKRVVEVSNETRMPLVMKAYAKEFIKKMVPDDIMHKGRPVTIEDVKKLQNKPLQRARAREVEHLIGEEPRNKLRMFVKNEPYSAPNDPRAITQCLAELTMKMSTFTYAFKEDILKKQPWYGPGKTPKGIHDRMREIGAKGTHTSDYWRYDGTITKDLQQMCNKIYLRWLNDGRDAETWIYCWRAVFLDQVTTKRGYKYDAGPGTRSGSPPTTDVNSMINAFLSYCGYRECGYDPDTAWSKLGLYTGDDGLNRYEEGFQAALKSVVKSTGMRIEIDECTGPDGPINFAGRTFPRPMTSYSSHQDVKRTLPKLHLSSNKGVDREIAAYNRAAGYYVTDAKTPIIGDWARRVLSIVGKVNDVDANMETLEALLTESMTSEEKFKIGSGAWPQEDPELIRQSVANILNETNDSLAIMQLKIKAAEDLDSFPVIWDNEAEYNPKLTALVNGVVIGPHQNKQCQESQLINNSSTSPPPTGSTPKERTTSPARSVKLSQRQNATGKKAQTSSQQDPPKRSRHSQPNSGNASSAINRSNQRELSPKYDPNEQQPSASGYKPRTPTLRKKPKIDPAVALAQLMKSMNSTLSDQSINKVVKQVMNMTDSY